MPRTRIIDGDGHVLEDAEAISGFLPSPYRELGPLASRSCSHHSTTCTASRSSSCRTPSARASPWTGRMAHLHGHGVQQAVLYPTWALAYGRMVNPGWAVAVCRAYNDWLYDTYTSRDDRFQGMA